MSKSKKELAREAIVSALRVRQSAGCNLRAAVCVYDLCERLDVEVRFADIPSMEGIYLPAASPKPAIIVSSLRPAGRRSVTCGHELGHHIFGHGEQWDELVEQRAESRQFDSKEYQADLSSAALHMPKVAVSHAFFVRKLDPTTCDPKAVYAVATWFGVGFTTLITHMASTLSLIEQGRADELRRVQPKDIRAAFLNRPCPENLIVVDQHWKDRAIDVQVGDRIILPGATSIEGQCASVVEQSNVRAVGVAETPGIARAVNQEFAWSAYIRVSRTGFVGRAPVRFDEEVGGGD